ncbi:MAG TPA: HNH endonuclease [Solirubrobacterales bacterium]|nr:HNH endonuclease [Solirubrobacterales bacterium]
MLPAIQGDDPALVIPSKTRLGQKTRFTVRFPGSFAYEGSRSGYAEHQATREERFWAISPRLLPAFVLMRQQGIELPARAIRTAVEAADALENDDDATKERARVVTTRLARSSTFRPKVLKAYEPKCALCDIGLDVLLEAAHIFPVNLPGSSDSAANGLPVCLHHHALLDEHKIYIDSDDLSVKLHPELRSGRLGESLSVLAATTEEALQVPPSLRKATVKRWLRKRAEAHEPSLKWALDP